jgi:hypothetical protein
MTVPQIIKAIQALPLAEQREIVEAVELSIFQAQQEDQTDWQDNFLPTSLLSPEDEKNVQRIWKSPGGC